MLSSVKEQTPLLRVLHEHVWLEKSLDWGMPPSIQLAGKTNKHKQCKGPNPENEIVGYSKRNTYVMIVVVTH